MSRQARRYNDGASRSPATRAHRPRDADVMAPRARERQRPGATTTRPRAPSAPPGRGGRGVTHSVVRHWRAVLVGTEIRGVSDIGTGKIRNRLACIDG